MNTPLSGRTILVTRPAHQAADLVRPLEALGARTYLLPAIEIAPLTEFYEFDRALEGLSEFDWVVLTSANGVEAVRRRLDVLGLTWPSNGTRPQLAVIGPATAEAARTTLGPPDLMPGEFVSEAIADALGEVNGLRILLARANRARRELPKILRERGAIVEEVAAYRIVDAEQNSGASNQELPELPPDAIALTSSAGVRGTLAALRDRGREAWMQESSLICIGPITADTVRELGYSPGAIANPYTIPALVDAVVKTLSGFEVGTGGIHV